MRKREIDRAVRRIVKRLQTPEGQAELKKAMADAEALIQELRRKRMVDPLTLFERVTI